MGMWVSSQMLLALFLLLTPGTHASGEKASVDRDGKLLPVFQVVKFTNEFCTSTTTSRNGTCYTSQECSDLGGTAGSDCAEGFGVCCSFELTCGGSSSQNATYIINTSPTQSCTYEICPSSTQICRVRFDFESFALSDPVLGTAQATGVANEGAAIGDCATDQFSITGPNQGSPVICGTNTGQHMILDSDGSTCHSVMALIDTDTTATRSWTIHVSQYTCQNRYSGGPSGCLQYFYDSGLSNAGTISNFGFDRSVTSIASTVTHLSNQQYNICIRRPTGCHAICYTSAITGSFGLSVSPDDAIAQATTNSNCGSDHLMIPGGSAQGIATNFQENPAGATTDPTLNKVCGRFLGTQAATAGASVCTRVAPFVIGVYTDADEVTTGTVGTANEQDTTPGGIIGFHLNYALQC